MGKVFSFWADKGASGFRIDAINHMFEDPDFKDEPDNVDVEDKNIYASLHHIYTKDLDETYDVVKGWRVLIDKYVSDKNIDPM